MQEDRSRSKPDSMEILLDKIIPLIPKAVKYTCYIGKHHISKEETEDLCQEVIIALIEDDYRRLRTFRQDSSIKTWIFKVVRHYVNNKLDGKKHTVNIDEVSPNLMALDPIQEKVILRRERIEFIQRMLAKSSQESLQLFEYTLYGLSDSEVADLLGIPSDTVRLRRFRIIKRLRQRFA